MHMCVIMTRHVLMEIKFCRFKFRVHQKVTVVIPVHQSNCVHPRLPISSGTREIWF